MYYMLQQKINTIYKYYPMNQIVFCCEEKEVLLEIPMFGGGKIAFSNMLS